MLRLSSILFAILITFVAASSQVPEPKQSQQTEKFVWSYGGRKLGTLDVPRGFTADTENYTEGIVTRLHYTDGSIILLQRGFMYRVPLFQDPEHILDSSKKTSDKTVRRGHHSGKTEVWGEVDYALRKSVHPGASLLEVVSPNLGYAHVPIGRGRDFARALESFVPPS